MADEGSTAKEIVLAEIKAVEGEGQSPALIILSNPLFERLFEEVDTLKDAVEGVDGYLDGFYGLPLVARVFDREPPVIVVSQEELERRAQKNPQGDPTPWVETVEE